MRVFAIVSLEQAAAAGELGSDHAAFNASDVRHDMAALYKSLQGLFFSFWDFLGYGRKRTPLSAEKLFVKGPLYRDLISRKFTRALTCENFGAELKKQNGPLSEYLRWYDEHLEMVSGHFLFVIVRRFLNVMYGLLVSGASASPRILP